MLLLSGRVEVPRDQPATRLARAGQRKLVIVAQIAVPALVGNELTHEVRWPGHRRQVSAAAAAAAGDLTR